MRTLGEILRKAVRKRGKGEDKIYKLQSKDPQPVLKALWLSVDVSISGTPGTSAGGKNANREKKKIKSLINYVVIII